MRRDQLIRAQHQEQQTRFETLQAQLQMVGLKVNQALDYFAMAEKLVEHYDRLLNGSPEGDERSALLERRGRAAERVVGGSRHVIRVIEGVLSGVPNDPSDPPRVTVPSPALLQ